jgi:multiple sugar transport system permease protein
VIVGLLFVFPFIWMILTSFKTLPQLLKAPLSLLPQPFTFQNYIDAWNDVPFAQAYFNSIYIAVLVVVGTIITASMAGYAFARIRFRGARVMFIVFLATQMIPAQVTLIPFYLLMSKLGWVDSHLSLIVPALLANPFAVFLMRQFVLSLPKELEEAALVDGATYFQAFRKVVLPLAAPGLVTAGLLTAFFVWNEFLLAQTLTSSPKAFTVPVAVANFTGSQKFEIPLGTISAASVVITIPLVAAVIIFQKRIVAGMTAGAVKG